MTERFIGLISGTSADGIDAALVTFDPAGRVAEPPVTLTRAYPEPLRRELLGCMRGDAALPLDTLGQLDQSVGEAFADPQVQARDMVVEIPHSATGKPEPYIASPLKIAPATK